MKKTNTYEYESCHNIGYGWQISAPATLTQEEIEAVLAALVDWTDEPDNKQLQAMLADNCYMADIDFINLANMETYKKITIDADTVHRESFGQNFKKVKAVRKANAKPN